MTEATAKRSVALVKLGSSWATTRPAVYIARRHAVGTVQRVDPTQPVVPPRAFVAGRTGLPGLGAWRQRLVRPVEVFLGGRRIHDAGDMARPAEHETQRP